MLIKLGSNSTHSEKKGLGAKRDLSQSPLLHCCTQLCALCKGRRRIILSVFLRLVASSNTPSNSTRMNEKSGSRWQQGMCGGYWKVGDVGEALLTWWSLTLV